ncbi:MAG: M12 family metallo-peptidase [Isosphaeraceae bacterium]
MRAALEGLERRDVPAVLGPWNTLDAMPALRSDLTSYLSLSSSQPFTVDASSLRDMLAQAPLESTSGATTSALRLPMPMPDGSFDEFAVVESPIMEPGLAAQFPDIKTYRGQGIDDPTATVRFDLTPQGFHAMIMSASGTTFIDPYYHLDTSLYVSYDRSAARDIRSGDAALDAALDHAGDVVTAPAFQGPLPLGADGLEGRKPGVSVSGGGITVQRSGTQLRTYRLAMAATGEYTQFQGGTVAAGQAAIVTAVNRVNQVYESDLSIRMTLIANNNVLVYTNPATDPYTNNDGSAMLGQNQTNLTNVIGGANYDIGHVFSTGGGGIAGLGVVGNSTRKAQGVTGLPSPIGDPFYIDYVAHEIGHQFNGNHTFNTSSDPNRNASTAYEPGSGSTIMAYAGITGANSDLQPNSDPYFHSISFDEIVNFVDNLIPSVGTRTATGNIVPTVDAGADYIIPAQTPFVLTATGSDGNGDPLTYSWEERDLGPAQLLNAADNGSSPLFRVWNPTTDPSRTFPRLSNLVANTLPLGEKLPTTNRQLKFRVTARDNRSGGGGVNTDDMVITVVNTGAAFAVTSPNTAVTWAGNSTQTVTWNVAGTNAGTINTPNVNILLSTDGGFTYTPVLSNVPNDGSQDITVPNIGTTQARIRVQGAGNIFFDISNVNFTITASTAANVITSVTSTVANGLYGIGASIPIQVVFNGPVAVTGFPTLALNSGGTATYSSGSGTSTLTFAYTVGAGQSTPDLDYTTTSALALSGGTILGGGIPASLTLPAPGTAGSLGANKNIVIDGVAPQVSEYRLLFGSRSYTRPGNPPRILPWQVTGVQVVFSEPIAGGNLASLAGLSATGFSGLGTNTLTWNLSAIDKGSFNTSLLASGASGLTDAAGNFLGGGTAYAQAFQVLYGDFNGDGFVTSGDFTGVYIAMAGPYNIFADINGDGVVDMADVQVVRRRIGNFL